MDWSLLRRHARYPWLRNELVFESYWPFYYWAMVTNIIGRFAWIIYLLPGPASNLLKIFIIALLEMFRRFQWNFLRLENEHLGNVDMYRISREIPLPYHFKQDRSAMDDEEDDEEAHAKVHPLAFKTVLSWQPWSDEKNRRAGSKEDGEGRGVEVSAPSFGLASAGKGKQPLSRKVRDGLVPDGGGYAATGARLDDVGAAHGAGARDYQPKRRDVDGDDAEVSTASSGGEEGPASVEEGEHAM